MVKITINLVLKAYSSLLNGEISFSDADRWAWGIMNDFDDGNLLFQPIQDEALIWELTQLLYGIDMPDIADRNKTSRTSIDIIEYLRKQNVYELVKAMK